MSVEPDYYSDQTHMNRTGGRAFCQSMAAFLDLLEHGQDVESLFITPDEYLANADFITNVYITPEVHPDKVVLLATSYQGPAVKPEYEFWAKGPNDADYQKITDYSDRTWAEFPLTEQGTYQFRVNARVSGTDTAFDRYYECSVDH